MKHVVLYAGHLYLPFWTVKNRPGRPEGPKVAIFGTFKNTQFWLFLSPPANPVEFLWSKMAGTGVPHIILHVIFDQK